MGTVGKEDGGFGEGEVTHTGSKTEREVWGAVSENKALTAEVVWT